MSYLPTTEEIVRNSAIAWRLLLLDGRAAAAVDNGLAAALRSFWCAAMALPAYCLYLLLQSHAPISTPGNFLDLADKAGLANAAATLAIVYVLGWVVWPLAVHLLMPLLDRDRFYFRYVVALNWMQLVLWGPLLLFAMLRFSGLVPEGAALAFNYAMLTVIWVFHWSVIRATLDVNGLVAAGLVVADFILRIMLKQVGVTVMMP